MEKEEWRQCPGLPVFYWVSSRGRVYSYALGDYLDVSQSGRVQVHVRRGMTMYIPVGVLVCRAWHGPPPSPEHRVLFLNDNPHDARVANVVWEGPGNQRMREARAAPAAPDFGRHVEHRTRAPQHPHEYLTAEQIADIHEQYRLILKGRRTAPRGWRLFIAKQYGVTVNVIQAILRSATVPNEEPTEDEWTTEPKSGGA